jgi:hypothetical protein
MSIITDAIQGINDKRAKSFASDHLMNDLAMLDADRGAFSTLRAQHQGAVGNTQGRLRKELGRSATAAVAQQERGVGPAFGGQLESAVRRMRARQGIMNRGEAAINNQSLKDRIEIARGSMRRRGQLQQSLQQAANIREGVNVGVQNANQIIAESNADLFGGIAGAGAGILKDPANRAKIGSFFRNIFNPPKVVASSTTTNLPQAGQVFG